MNKIDSPGAAFFDLLDPGIRDHVRVLLDAGVETYESCEGGPGHAYAEPTIRFHGSKGEGFRALSVALNHQLPVRAINRVWEVWEDREPHGPHWEMVFWSAALGTKPVDSFGGKR